jgi:hypothetical protein
VTVRIGVDTEFAQFLICWLVTDLAVIECDRLVEIFQGRSSRLSLAGNRSVCPSLSTSRSDSRRVVRPAIVAGASSPAVINGPVLYH